MELIDLTRFMTAVEGSRGTGFLSPEPLGEFTADPHLPGATGSHYGLGIVVNQAGEWWHNGSSFGYYALLLRRQDGYVIAVALNSRSEIDNNSFTTDVAVTLQAALGTGLEGSSSDLYDLYPSLERPARYPY